MELYRGYKFRIYPNKKQQAIIDQNFNSCNFVYNYFIREQRKNYQQTGKLLSVNQCIRKLPSLKNEYPQLKNSESTSLQQEIRHLGKAYSNYFNHRALYPRYKSNDLDHSYTCTKNGCVPSNIRIEDNFLILPKLGKVKVNFHQNLPENAEISSATIKLNHFGKYEVTLLTSSKIKIEEEEEPKVLGLVYSPEFFFIGSDGSRGKIPDSYYKTQERITFLKKKLKLKQDGSKNKLKVTRKLRKAYERAGNIKRDYLHKWSRSIANRYNTVVVKELNTEIFNSTESNKKGWNKFISFLKYKLEQKGGRLIIITQDEIPDPVESEINYETGVVQAKELTNLITK